MSEISYAKIEDCLDVADMLTEKLEKNEILKASLFGNLLEASRQFERESNARTNFYAPALTNEETDKVYKLRRGASVLVLPPFVSISAVFDFEEEELDGNYWTILDDIFGNYAIKFAYPYRIGCTRIIADYTIRGVWGWQCTPSDVRFAVKSKGLLNFFTNPTARKGLSIKLTDEQTGRLRSDYNRIVRQWNKRNRTYYGGLGIG
jgi:hypothetical protein